MKDRPGHDYRYAVDFSKASKLGWSAKENFKEGFKKTVDWYVQNQKWLESKTRYLKDYWAKVYKS